MDARRARPTRVCTATCDGSRECSRSVGAGYTWDRRCTGARLVTVAWVCAVLVLVAPMGPSFCGVASVSASVASEHPEEVLRLNSAYADITPACACCATTACTCMHVCGVVRCRVRFGVRGLVGRESWLWSLCHARAPRVLGYLTSPGTTHARVAGVAGDRMFVAATGPLLVSP